MQTSKFSVSQRFAPGMPTASAGIVTSGIAAPDKVGATMTPDEVVAHTTGNRVGLYVLGGVVLLVAIVAAVAFAFGSRHERGNPADIGRSSLTNDYEAATVEVFAADSSVTVECSGVFVGKTGQILTAVHCLQADPDFCDFDTTTGQYDFRDDLFDEVFYADVMGVNGGTEKRTYTVRSNSLLSR
jgi:hypothetical protein